MSTQTNQPGSGALSYKDAGVDIDAGDALVDRIKPLAKKTMREGVLAGIGGFGALFEVPKRYKEPVLVSGTDGVGTKLKMAFALNRHSTVGIDLVAMSVNDILVQGAEPLFFLDYFACGKLHVDTAASVIGGIAKGCELSNCALIGGETAEMPSMYPDGEYDLAGFAVGVVEKSAIITGQDIVAGDVLLGLASSGPHSNGYSLIRKVLERSFGSLESPELQKPIPGETSGPSLADVVMEPTRLYVKSVLEVMKQVSFKGLAHITGGGLLENVPRVLPAHVQAQIHQSAWPLPKLFMFLQKEGQIDWQEMYRVFNCGIGMVIVVAADQADAAHAALERAGETVYRLGQVVSRPAPNAPQTVVIRE